MRPNPEISLKIVLGKLYTKCLRSNARDAKLPLAAPATTYDSPNSTSVHPQLCKAEILFRRLQ